MLSLIWFLAFERHQRCIETICSGSAIFCTCRKTRENGRQSFTCGYASRKTHRKGKYFTGSYYYCTVSQNKNKKHNIIKTSSITVYKIRSKRDNASSFRVKSVKELQMNVNLCGGKFHGRVHVTHICDDVTEVRAFKPLSLSVLQRMAITKVFELNVPLV